jgi:hypothetical protein
VISIFVCPARDEEDRVALEMLQQVLDPARWRLERIAPTTLTAELLDQVAEQKPALVCIAALPPGGISHTRYLCKRLRSRFPDIRILVGRWGLKAIVVASHTPPEQEAGTLPADGPMDEFHADTLTKTLQEAGADLVATTLLETRQQLGGLLPVLAQDPLLVAGG